MQVIQEMHKTHYGTSQEADDIGICLIIARIFGIFSHLSCMTTVLSSFLPLLRALCNLLLFNSGIKNNIKKPIQKICSKHT